MCCAALLAAAGGSMALAEESTFNISDYIPEKFVDLEWKVMGNLGLNNYDIWSSTYRPTSNLHHSTQTRDIATWSGGLKSRLAYRYQTVPRFLSTTLDITGSYDWEKENTTRNRTGSDFSEIVEEYELSRSESKSARRELSTVAYADVGQYLSGDFFASIGASVRFMYEESPGATDYYFQDRVDYYAPRVRTLLEERSSEHSPDMRHVLVSMVLLPGWGRLYRGNYASTAMYIIEELRSNGVLLREPTHDEMLALCDIVYQNRLEHAVDERIRKIESLDAIMSYLSDVGISDAGNGRACLLIQDVWDYFPRYGRTFGFRARLGPGFDYSHNRDRSTTISDYYRFLSYYDISNPGVVDTLYDYNEHEYRYQSTITEAYDTYLRAIVEYAKPLSRQWQLDLWASGKYYFSSHITRAEWYSRYVVDDDGSNAGSSTYGFENDIDSRYRFDLVGTATYILNSRTQLSFRTDYSYEYFKADPESDFLLDPDVRETTKKEFLLAGGVTYRISIPTALTASVGYRHDRPGDASWYYVNSRYTEDRYFAGVSLSHYIY